MKRIFLILVVSLLFVGNAAQAGHEGRRWLAQDDSEYQDKKFKRRYQQQDAPRERRYQQQDAPRERRWQSQEQREPRERKYNRQQNQQNTRYISKGQAIDMVQRRVKGRVLSAETVHIGNRAVHRIKVLTPRAEVRVISIDAEKGWQR
jgi:uncharacterized membrane protein YkoI